MNDEAWHMPTHSVPLAEEKTVNDNWKRFVYSDEVFWRYRVYRSGCDFYYNVARFPFVPGYFLCRVLAEHNEDGGETECHLPVAGPFPNLKSAMTACIALGPQQDFEG